MTVEGNARRGDFFAYMTALHAEAGRPSYRTIARECEQPRPSHTTVRHVLRGPKAPDLRYVRPVVHYLGGDFDVARRLWGSATVSEDVDASTPNAEIGLGVSSARPASSTDAPDASDAEEQMSTDGRRPMTSAEQREQLATIAMVVFAQHGFEGASVEDIAARAEVSKPIVYEHFGGKEGLYAVVVDREISAFRERLTATRYPRDASVVDVFRAALRVLLTYVEDRPSGYGLLFRDSGLSSAYGANAQVVGELTDALGGRLSRLLESRGVGKAMVKLQVDALVAALLRVAATWAMEREPSRGTVCAEFPSLLLSGDHV